MIDFSKMRFLVVDDFSEFRSSIRGILRLLGVQQIDTAANGNDVLELCRRNRYDAILHDYNLGEGLSGQQVLEQLHAEKLLAAHCIFIMVTAESTQAMVLAALECEPDDYLTKPFNKVALQTRLERLIRRKKVLAPVLKALEAGDQTAVLQACQAIEDKEPRHAVLCLRYKAEALQELARYQELEQMLEQQARSRPTGWNLQALAGLWLCQGRLDQVTRLLTAAVRQFPMMPELHDIQAALAAQQNNLPAMQEALQQAVALSPNTVRRQINLASQAWLNNNLDVAANAIKQSWEIGRYSATFDPELLWQLSSMLTQAAGERRMPDDAQHWLKTIERSWQQAQPLQPAAALLRIEQGRRQGKAYTAAELEPLLAALHSHKRDYAAITLLQLGDWLALLEQKDAAESFWRFCAERHAGITGVLEQIALRLPTLDTQPLRKAISLSRQATALHTQEKTVDAQALFDQALQLAPQLIELNIAAARLALEQMSQQHAGATQRLRASLERIGSLSKLEPQSNQFSRMQSSLELSPW